MGDVDAVETDGAVGRLLEPEHGAADGGLAAAGFADQAERLAGAIVNDTSSTACTVAILDEKMPAPRSGTAKYLRSSLDLQDRLGDDFGRGRGRGGFARAARLHQRAGGDLVGADAGASRGRARSRAGSRRSATQASRR